MLFNFLSKCVCRVRGTPGQIWQEELFREMSEMNTLIATGSCMTSVTIQCLCGFVFHHTHIHRGAHVRGYMKQCFFQMNACIEG